MEFFFICCSDRTPTQMYLMRARPLNSLYLCRSFITGCGRTFSYCLYDFAIKIVSVDLGASSLPICGREISREGLLKVFVSIKRVRAVESGCELHDSVSCLDFS